MHISEPWYLKDQLHLKITMIKDVAYYHNIIKTKAILDCVSVVVFKNGLLSSL